jgi:hypothetical protein
MIRYRLKCEKRHEFEAWFASSAAFDHQAKRGQIACPRCGTAKVHKSPMAPSIIKGAKRTRTRKAAEQPAAEPQAATPQPTPAPPPAETHRLAAHGELAKVMRKLRAEIEAKSEYVGPRFPEEARKIHYEEAPQRGIYGEATREEAQALSDEGIEFFPLPPLPEDHN